MAALPLLGSQFQPDDKQGALSIRDFGGEKGILYRGTDDLSEKGRRAVKLKNARLGCILKVAAFPARQ
jgi:hypothetical protein